MAEDCPLKTGDMWAPRDKLRGNWPWYLACHDVPPSQGCRLGRFWRAELSTVHQVRSRRKQICVVNIKIHYKPAHTHIPGRALNGAGAMGPLRFTPWVCWRAGFNGPAANSGMHTCRSREATWGTGFQLRPFIGYEKTNHRESNPVKLKRCKSFLFKLHTEKHSRAGRMVHL